MINHCLGGVSGVLKEVGSPSHDQLIRGCDELLMGLLRLRVKPFESGERKAANSKNQYDAHEDAVDEGISRGFMALRGKGTRLGDHRDNALLRRGRTAVGVATLTN
jgi:hypothetical protein